MTPDPSSISIAEPFPINLVADRYLLYDINVITYIRREHHMCGVLIGGLPQFPQQNVFLGIPLELMPEEARLLVDKGAAFIVDDVQRHAALLPQLRREEKIAYLKILEREGQEVARDVECQAEQRREKALEKLKKKASDAQSIAGRDVLDDKEGREPDDDVNDHTIFTTVHQHNPVSKEKSPLQEPELQAYAITPTTSYPPLNPPQKTLDSQAIIPQVPRFYPLFAHLHARNYFLSPGLRFGCQYLVYPGDPLRFHSHFLAVAAGWDEPLDLLDIVGGGRLGTGVKKSFLVGGVVEDGNDHGENDGGDCAREESERVRTFCIEWGGM